MTQSTYNQKMAAYVTAGDLMDKIQHYLLNVQNVYAAIVEETEQERIEIFAQFLFEQEKTYSDGFGGFLQGDIGKTIKDEWYQYGFGGKEISFPNIDKNEMIASLDSIKEYCDQVSSTLISLFDRLYSEQPELKSAHIFKTLQERRKGLQSKVYLTWKELRI